MIQSFADETTADLFRAHDTKAARKIAKDLWRVPQRKLKMLDVARKLEDLKAPPGNHLETLKGGMAGRHSIRVNDRFRVTFRWENGNAFEVAVEDYH